VRIDIEDLGGRFAEAQKGKKSEHSAEIRVRPSRLMYDYPVLNALADAMHQLVGRLADAPQGAIALDLGSCRSPYRELLLSKGFAVRTLDLTREENADYVGTVEATGLPDESFHLVLCTQVLEHSDNPWLAAKEIRRILRPGGHAIISVPHVWFYHPHPHDHWRFTQEGLVRLCRENGLHPEAMLAQGGSILAVGQILNFMVYGVLGRWGAPFYLLMNILAGGLDKVIPNELFCQNFACLASRVDNGTE
jgi:SAM-dependent methyltransferase